MHFCLVDRVIEKTDNAIVTIKLVSAAEEYLQDHFAGFPVLPGVMMLEAMVQAARELARERAGGRLVLGSVRGLKYGRFVKPGDTLRLSVSLHKAEGAILEFKGEGTVGDQTAVSGRFTLRPIAG